VVAYLGDEDSPSEPDFQYIPDTPSLASVGGDPLTASMTLLKDGLDTGTTVAQFEVRFIKRINYLGKWYISSKNENYFITLLPVSCISVCIVIFN